MDNYFKHKTSFWWRKINFLVGREAKIQGLPRNLQKEKEKNNTLAKLLPILTPPSHYKSHQWRLFGSKSTELGLVFQIDCTNDYNPSQSEENSSIHSSSSSTRSAYGYLCHGIKRPLFVSHSSVSYNSRILITSAVQLNILLGEHCVSAKHSWTSLFCIHLVILFG